MNNPIEIHQPSTEPIIGRLGKAISMLQEAANNIDQLVSKRRTILREDSEVEDRHKWKRPRVRIVKTRFYDVRAKKWVQEETIVPNRIPRGKAQNFHS